MVYGEHMKVISSESHLLSNLGDGWGGVLLIPLYA